MAVDEVVRHKCVIGGFCLRIAGPPEDAQLLLDLCTRGCGYRIRGFKRADRQMSLVEMEGFTLGVRPRRP